MVSVPRFQDTDEIEPVDAAAESADEARKGTAAAEQRLALATHVVENTGSLEQLRARVAEVHAELTA